MMKKISLDETRAHAGPITAPVSDDNKVVKSKKPILFAGVILLGLVSGVIFARLSPAANTTTSSSPSTTEESSKVKVGATFGDADDTKYSDIAEGILASGGMEGDGSHHIIRGAGSEDQYVYISSSVVNLDQFVGHKIEVWGQTHDAQKAGWLMLVGYVKVLELNAELPTK